MLRISEHYTSFQGEGPNVGTPTQFFRFAGCNLRCPGWPCDSQHAIDPKTYRHEWSMVSAQEAVGMCVRQRQSTGASNVCLTGGEPLLQNTVQLSEMVLELKRRGFTVECFTNGSLDCLDDLADHVDYVMDWKLPGSGEFIDVVTDQQLSNVQTLTLPQFNGRHVIKFTITDRTDFAVAAARYYNYLVDHIAGGPIIRVYCGVVWDKMETSELAALIHKYKIPWHLNVQMHNYIWPPHERAR